MSSTGLWALICDDVLAAIEGQVDRYTVVSTSPGTVTVDGIDGEIVAFKNLNAQPGDEVYVLRRGGDWVAIGAEATSVDTDSDATALAMWGGISGDIDNQEDLQAALREKMHGAVPDGGLDVDPMTDPDEFGLRLYLPDSGGDFGVSTQAARKDHLHDARYAPNQQAYLPSDASGSDKDTAVVLTSLEVAVAAGEVWSFDIHGVMTNGAGGIQLATQRTYTGGSSQVIVRGGAMDTNVHDSATFLTLGDVTPSTDTLNVTTDPCWMHAHGLAIGGTDDGVIRLAIMPEVDGELWTLYTPADMTATRIS